MIHCSIKAVEHASSVWDLSTVQCGKAEGVIFGKAVIELLGLSLLLYFVKYCRFEENLDGLKTAIVQFRKFIAMGELRCAWAVPLNFLHRHAVEVFYFVYSSYCCSILSNSTSL